MTFANYTATNNAASKIAAGISPAITAVILETGYGALFPSTFPFKAKIEKYEAGTGKVLKREVVTVTNRVSDTVTIARATEACPASDDATTQTSTAFSFDEGDSFILALTGEQLENANNELVRLENAKLNVADYQNGTKVYAATSTGTDTYAITLSPVPAALLTGMVFKFSADVANTGAATLNVNALGAKTIKKMHDRDLQDGDIEAGQIVTVSYDGTYWQMDSQIATIPTVDINGLVEDTAPDIDNDFFLTYDASASVNKKSKLSSIRATLSEILTGTSILKFITPSGLRNEVKTDYGTTYTAHTIADQGVIANSYVNAGSYALAAQVTAQKTGKFRISCTLADTTGNSLKMSVQLKVNGAVVQQVDGSYGDPSGFTTDFNDFVINQGDVIAFYVKVIQAQYPSNNETVSFSGATFKYKYYWEGLTYFS